MEKCELQKYNQPENWKNVNSKNTFSLKFDKCELQKHIQYGMEFNLNGKILFAVGIVHMIDLNFHLPIMSCCKDILCIVDTQSYCEDVRPPIEKGKLQKSTLGGIFLI